MAPQFRLYIATSLDGYIATSDGGVAWLDDFQGEDYAYEQFMEEIECTIMGRKTYEQVRTFGDWPYPNQKSFVLSSKNLEHLPEKVVLYSESIHTLKQDLLQTCTKDIWIVGGAGVIQSFLMEKLLDQLILFIMPVLLGSGIPLFGDLVDKQALTLESLESYKNGVVKTIYNCL